MNTNQKTKIAEIIRKSNKPMSRREIAEKLNIHPSGIRNNINLLCKEGYVNEHDTKPYTYSWSGKTEEVSALKQMKAHHDNKKNKKVIMKGSIEDYKQSKDVIHNDAMNYPIPINADAWRSDDIISFSSLPGDVQLLINDTLDSIRNDKGEYCLNRIDVFSERDIDKKFLKVLMWGYPKAKVFNTNKCFMSEILKNKSKIIPLIDKLKDNDFNESEFMDKTKELSKTNGIGISTFSKLMYFFNVKINGNPCIIFDSRVKNAFVRYSQTEFLDKYNQQNINSYPKFVEGISRISNDTGIEADSIEFILFSVSGSDKKFQEFNTKYKKP